MEINKEKVKAAMDGILMMCEWQYTPQGHEYWSSARAELESLLRDTESHEPQPQYREPNEGDVDKEIEIRGDGEEKWRTGKLLAIDDGWFVCAVKFFEFTASIATRHARIAVEPAAPAEPKWITPTDEDAKRRPEVEVRDEEWDEWIPGKLYAVLDDVYECRFLCVAGEYIYQTYRQCRMRKDEQ